MVALVDSQLTEADKALAQRALLEAGATDKTLKGLLKSALKKLGEKIADDVGEALAEDVADYIGPLLDSSKAGITAAFKSLFPKNAA